MHEHTKLLRDSLHQLGFPRMVVIMEGDSGFGRYCCGEWRRLLRSESWCWAIYQLLTEYNRKRVLIKADQILNHSPCDTLPPRLAGLLLLALDHLRLFVDDRVFRRQWLSNEALGHGRCFGRSRDATHPAHASLSPSGLPLDFIDDRLALLEPPLLNPCHLLIRRVQLLLLLDFINPLLQTAPSPDMPSSMWIVPLKLPQLLL